jgi:protein-S-isoprenylcysteine O-methyltransferase Ste14
MHPLTTIISICWLVFWLYWLISAFSSKKNATSNIKRFMGIRLVLLVLAVILFRSLNSQNYSLQNRTVTNSGPVLAIGFIAFLMGLAVAIWARVYLGKNWGMPMTQKQDPELVTSGPYQYIRHPIYSGILLAMLGCAIAVSVFWLAVFAIAGLYFVYSALEEEKLMLKQFPKVYPAYKSKTKMLIPFVF